MSYTEQHLREASAVIEKLDADAIERTAVLLAELRERRGRLFLLGVGGSAANCSHAVNDFRKICGIVGRDGGYTAKVADACVIIPTVNPQNVTPHTEAFQAVVWHLLVSHPKLKVAETKWESTR